MFEKIEEIYIDKNSSDEKIRWIALFSIVVTAILMFIFLIMKKTVLLYVVTFVFLITIFILKISVYLKRIKPGNLRELILTREKYKRMLYNETRKSIKEMLKKENSYKTDSINMLINYYKDIEPNKKFDVNKITSYIFSFLAAFGVLPTIEQLEILNTIYILILFITLLLIFWYILNKMMDKLFDGVIDSQVNYKQIYKMLNEIYLEIISNKYDRSGRMGKNYRR